MTQQLSLAARSVFESFNSKFDWVEDGVPGPQFKAIAAALRAAAYRVAPARPVLDSCCEHYDAPKQSVTSCSLSLANSNLSSRIH
jgi:hypothetical protein